jgi:hypothetical protein
MLNIPNRAGQPYKALWYKTVQTYDGEQQNATTLGIWFQCAKTQATRTSRSFRDGIEGKSFSCVIATTDTAKLKDIETIGGKIQFDGSMRLIAYAEMDINNVLFIALE